MRHEDKARCSLITLAVLLLVAGAPGASVAQEPPKPLHTITADRFETGDEGRAARRKAPPQTATAQPAGSRQAGRWRITLTGGYTGARNPSNGIATATPPGTDFTAPNGRASQRIYSPNLGPGPILLNQVVSGIGPSRVLPIDQVVMGPSGLEEGSYFFGGRIGVSVGKFVVYGSWEASPRTQLLTGTAADAITQSAASTSAMFNDLLSGAPTRTVSSVATVEEANYQGVTIGAGGEYVWRGLNLAGFQEASTYFGVKRQTGSGDPARAIIETSYGFNLNGSPFSERNTTTISASRSGAWGFETGLNLSRPLASKADFVVGLGIEGYQNTQTITVGATSSRTTTTPGGVVIFTTTPTYVISNVEQFNSSLSLPLVETNTWKGEGMIWRPRVSAGIRVRF